MDKATFKRKRERLGLTQEELAKKLGKSRPSIARYEAGTIPVPEAIEKLLRFIEAAESK
jgi:transcriptional regulator with XRE-family HTH domain